MGTLYYLVNFSINMKLSYKQIIFKIDFKKRGERSSALLYCNNFKIKPAGFISSNFTLCCSKITQRRSHLLEIPLTWILSMTEDWDP